MELKNLKKFGIFFKITKNIDEQKTENKGKKEKEKGFYFLL